MTTFWKGLARKIRIAFAPGGWSYLRLLRLRREMHGLYFNMRSDSAQELCREMHWPCRVAVKIDEGKCPYTFLACTPFGIVSFITENFRVERSFHVYEDFYLKKNFRDRNPLEEHIQAAGGMLSEGATPLIVKSGSMHQYLGWGTAWTKAQNGLAGWSGQVQYLPMNLAADASGAEGLGSCIVAVRQGNIVVLVTTALDQMDGWFCTGKDASLHRAQIGRVFCLNVAA